MGKNAVHYGFELKTSNDLSCLAAQLRGDLAAARSVEGEDPFYSEVIVVNSRGMEHWLVQQLAGVDGNPGIQANLRFVTPHELVEFVVSQEGGAVHRWGERRETPDFYDRDVLAWRLYRLLGEEAAKQDSPFETLIQYFDPDRVAVDGIEIDATDERADRRRYQLAVQLADVYDQYQIHRPQWLEAWRGNQILDGGPDLGKHDWQPALWRRLQEDRPDSRDARIAGARHRIKEIAGICAAGELKRVWLFGISTMAPCILALFRDLGGHLPVGLYLRSPSDCYWLEDESEKRHLGRLQKRYLQERTEEVMLASSLDGGDVCVEGNPLLASCGDQVREFLRVLDDLSSDYPHCRVDLSDNSGFIDDWVDASTLLGHLQLSVLNATAVPVMPGSMVARVQSGADASLRFHSCHSPLREIEVLRDNLLDWFNGSGGKIDRHPRRIVVMAPNIEAYVPFIEAVFNRRGQGGKTYLPYLIADRTSVAESAVVQAFLDLLHLPEARFRVSEVFDLLGVGAIARAYTLDAVDIARLQRWVKDANVHWGLDGAHRHAMDEDFKVLGEAYGWQFGMDRLLAGYGIGLPDNDDFFNGVVPLDEVEGGDAARLGRFGLFLNDLREARTRFSNAKSVSAWQADLEWALDQFFVGDDNSYADLAALRQHVERLARHATAADAGDALPPAVVASCLTAAVSAAQSSSLFCRGKITFCSMLPMRSIPADFVWLLGMNDGVFPRTDPRRDFNLIQSGKPQACDRSRRKDDRYLFLEALTSARHRFQISYIGRSNKDNGKRPPSAIVRELMNELRPRLPDQYDDKGEAADSVFANLVVDHRLHAFSGGYFEPVNSRRFSYSTTAAEDADTHRLGSKLEPSLFGTPSGEGALLPEPADAALPTTAELARFYTGPAEALLKTRFSLYLSDDSVQLADDEPLRLDGLEGYGIGQQLMRHCAGLIETIPDDEALEAGKAQVFSRLQAEGALPPAALGLAAFEEKWTAAEAFARYNLPEGDLKLTTVIDAGAEGVVLASSGEAGGRASRMAAFGRLSSIKAKDKIKALVYHLARNATAPQRTVLGGWNKTNQKVSMQQLRPALDDGLVAQAQDDYALLVRLYEIGMRLPLPFSPGPSFAYAKKYAEATKKNAKAEDLTEDEKVELTQAAAMLAAEKEWVGDDFAKAYDGIDKAANRYCYGANGLFSRDAWQGVLKAGEPAGLSAVRFDELALKIWEIWTRWGGK